MFNAANGPGIFPDASEDGMRRAHPTQQSTQISVRPAGSARFPIASVRTPERRRTVRRGAYLGTLLVCALAGGSHAAHGEATELRTDSAVAPAMSAAGTSSGSVESGAPEIQLLVEALFTNKAMIRVNGKRHLLGVGEPGPYGLVLINADANGAVVEVNGVRQTLALGRRIAANYAPPPQGVIVRLAPGADGLYRSQGAINGVGTEMLIDTGASSVALNRTLAIRLGLGFENDRQKVRVETAAGPAVAWRVTLDRLRVGRIEQHDVPALVIDAESPTSVLIGSSFLKGVDIRREGQIMTLEQK